MDTGEQPSSLAGREPGFIAETSQPGISCPSEFQRRLLILLPGSFQSELCKSTPALDAQLFSTVWSDQPGIVFTSACRDAWQPQLGSPEVLPAQRRKVGLSPGPLLCTHLCPVSHTLLPDSRPWQVFLS